MSGVTSTSTIDVLLIGANGQLGNALQTSVPLGAIKLHAMSRAELDFTSELQLEKKFAEVEPQVVINAAAYTAVDKAESDVERAYQINEEGPKLLAKIASQVNCRIIHISSDFVFDGKKSSPYQPHDDTNPLSVYGKSKLLGELALLEYAESMSTIIRTSWLYSASRPCFLASMLSLMASRSQLGIVADQVGSPTSVNSLALLIWKVVERAGASGVYHWSDAGVASWYDFAVAIQKQALEVGILKCEVDVTPIIMEQYPTPATRPHYSVMDKTKTYEDFGVDAVHWQNELQKVIVEIKR